MVAISKKSLCQLCFVISVLLVYWSVNRSGRRAASRTPPGDQPAPPLQRAPLATSTETSGVVRRTPSGCRRERRTISIQNACRKHDLSEPGANLARRIRTDSDFALPIIVDDRHRLLFCPVLKAASTSFIKLLANLTGLVRNVSSFHDPRSIHSLGLRFLNELREGDIRYRLENYFKFMVVRHPFDRLRSAYVDKFAGPGPLHNYFPRYASLIREHFAGDASRPWTGRDRITFEQFLVLVARHPRRFSNGHWMTFVNSCRPCHIAYDVVVKMETFDDDVAVVMDRLKTPNPDPSLLPKHGVHRATQAEERLREVNDLFKDLDEDVIASLLEVYRWDFEIFGYTWSSATGPDCLRRDARGRCC